jgi:hypothetical protein
MANYEPPTENLPIFDVTTFRNDNPYSDIYLARKGIATSEATETSFSGLVNFNNLATPPHCSAVPTDPNDLANKAYVDALAPQTSYIVYLNHSQTFTTSTPTIYKKLNPLTNNTPTPVTIHTINTTPLLIAGFFNTKADLKFANSIPAGLWSLILYANCAATNDQNHIGLNFTLIGVTALGVETIIAPSVYSPLINVLAPLVGTYSCVLTVPTAIDITIYDQIGIKVYALSNTTAHRDGTIFFQYPSYYSALQTSFATTQAADLTTTNNTWTGTNTFQNITNLNTTIIQGTGSIQFPDLSIQTTAFKSLTAGIYTNSNITVDADGAISAISTGVGGANATTIDLANILTGPAYNVILSTTSSGSGASLLTGSLNYDQDANMLNTNTTSSTNLKGGSAGKIPYQSGVDTTAFLAVGTAGQVFKSNGAAPPSWTTDIGGNAGSSTTVALTGDDGNGDYSIPYSKTSTATSNALYIDNTTTPLTYNANFGRMSAAAYTVGDKVQIAGTNSSLIRQSTVALDHINNATSGFHKFTVYDATPAAITPLTIGSTNIATTVPLNIVTTVAGSTPSFTIRDTTGTSLNILGFRPTANGGDYNSIVVAGDNLIYASGTVNNEVLTLTSHSVTTTGIRIQPNAILLGSGGGVGTPTTNISISGSAGTLAYTSTTCPTQAGYTVPAGSDSSTNIATTAWVQAAIPLGTSALATNMSGGVIGNVLYQASAGNTTRMTNGVVGTVLTSGGVGSVPSWQANLAGNAGSATAVALVSASSGSDWIPVSSVETGNSALRTNTNLKYNHTTNTIQGNVTGSAGSATQCTNINGGLAGNLLYQQAGGVTTQLVNGASGTVLISGGVGSNPSWNANIAGNAGSSTYASNTTVVNDAASATSHALTFVSNISGNLPIKTRANISTGAGLSYVPSTNVLTVNAAGVGTVATAKIAFTDNLGQLAEINNGGGTVSIINRDPSNTIIIQTADSAGTVASRVSVTDTNTVIYNKLQTDAGIIGPATSLTYTADMIGYVVKKNGTLANFTVVNTTIYSVHASGTNGVTLAAGVWMVNLSVLLMPSVTAGTVFFVTSGLTTDGVTPYTYTGGTGTLTGTGTASIPANANSRLFSDVTTAMVSDGSAYYLVFNASFLTFTLTGLAANCYFQATRIA